MWKLFFRFSVQRKFIYIYAKILQVYVSYSWTSFKKIVPSLLARGIVKCTTSKTVTDLPDAELEDRQQKNTSTS